MVKSVRASVIVSRVNEMFVFQITEIYHKLSGAETGILRQSMIITKAAAALTSCHHRHYIDYAW